MLYSTRKSPDGGRRGGGTIFDAKLYEYLLKMLVDGARADIEYLADVAIGLAAADPQKHFRFTCGQYKGCLQIRAVALGAGVPRLGQSKQQFVGTQGTDERAFEQAIGNLDAAKSRSLRMSTQLQQLFDDGAG